MRYALAFGLWAAMTVGSTGAHAAKSPAPKGALSLAEGKALVKSMDKTPGFPVVMNEAVLERLNFFLSERGRKNHVKSALRRMEAIRPMLESELDEHDVPDDLLAIPLVESSYRNLPPALPKGAVTPSAGLWQFTKSTARQFGLKVNEKVDQRLDPKRSTDAALRLLNANYDRYGDWMLALAAYNQGTVRVDKALATSGHRDAWRLVDDGHLNDYIVNVMAGVILINNPQLVR